MYLLSKLRGKLNNKFANVAVRDQDMEAYLYLFYGSWYPRFIYNDKFSMIRQNMLEENDCVVKKCQNMKTVIFL